ncbi:P-loop containing nucleoside triphosphate hydrolases superfamily protein [Perilla frutescens var. hirtella]|uniref:P-loop containing nucleoside triphosphate hydrolases superfamily protein n=1 Tax=Perilla frutescens var. hirtella TaxID=608512 RepID=A0AAD4IPU1_PERFH|nr:P-loop containing nucleoside triphosphate hydrolases superfamily protein [Perilla frutescens var. hirtella]
MLLLTGDRVTYVGKGLSIIEEMNNRFFSTGQRGEVYEVKGESVGVVFNICGLKTTKTEKDETNTEASQQAVVTWLDVEHVSQDHDARTHDSLIAMEALYEVLASQQPLIVYFPHSYLGISESRYNTHQEELLIGKMKNIFYQLSEGLVMICAENKGEVGSKEMEKFPQSLKKYINGVQFPRGHQQVSEMSKLFTNVVCIKPPKDGDLMNSFIKLIEEHRLTLVSQGNLSTLRKVLEEHNLSCTNLERVNVKDVILTREEVENVVGWATNHYLSTCSLPCVSEEKLHIPLESMKLAILRLKGEEEEEEEETRYKKQPNSIKDLATCDFEKRLVSAVVLSEDIGVKFDDVGSLENVKRVLYETVILPMRRPELFSHGKLLKPCKGILLFGPPGTGKTLVAKALATESGANFINITTAAITSKWLGETENLTRAIFTFASKLAPAIIFIDEVDSLLGARGHNKYDTSRLNEFMAAWDGLNSKESERILVIGATNRPFDLDEAVIRRMPRRIYVGLPDVENRSKILEVLLKKENLESGFSFEQLAKATEGYSGSDLKNLCSAAAYRSVQEFIEQESKGEGVAALRPLHFNDFIKSKAKVKPSVAHNASSTMKLREWNEQYGEGVAEETELVIGAKRN